MLAGLFALTTAALFTGAAVVISLAEQPARLTLDDGPLIAQWQQSYGRAKTMQASLAVVGFVLGLVAWWQTGDWLWVAGAVALIANWPYTLLVIQPINTSLMAMRASLPGRDTRALIEKWGRLHAVRGMLGAAATLLFVLACENRLG